MIVVQDLSKSFGTPEGTLEAVQGLTFTVPTGSFFTLLGPSGCGKSTTMRMLAGLERPDRGQISSGEVTWASDATGTYLSPNKRSLGMVFQSYAIWPHMTVEENVAYPLKVKKVPSRERRQLVDDALEIVGLGQLGRRAAPRLSGGQQQRVALARAIVTRPDVLLLDEPLSNLDARLRLQMCVELKRLQSEIGITTIYVTHDQNEALSMSDEIALLERGRLVQGSSPLELYARPATRFAAEFVGSTNVFPVLDAVGTGPGDVIVDTVVGGLRATADLPISPGAQAVVAVRPEEIEVDAEIFARDEGGERVNSLVATLRAWIFLGDVVQGEMDVNGTTVMTKSLDRSLLDIAVGSQLALSFPDRAARVLADDVADRMAGALG